jgi:AP2 domain
MNLPKQEPRPTADDTRLIPLTQGQFAIVDAADFDWLNQWKWRSGDRHNGKKSPNIQMHRQILGLESYDPRQGDHRKGGTTLDNRRSNLRIVAGSDNAKNRRKNRKGSSRFKGVFFHKSHRRWEAQIQCDHKHINLGGFPTEETAYTAYCEAAKRLHGEFANLGEDQWTTQTVSGSAPVR